MAGFPDYLLLIPTGLCYNSLTIHNQAPTASNLLWIFKGGNFMEQRFEGKPQAKIHLEGRKVVRTDVVNDWGLRLQWEIRRNGRVIATPNARVHMSYLHEDVTPGMYEIVLQMWRYVNYAKNAQGEFVNSQFIDISNCVSYTI
jgi:hypothetical protein